MDLEGWERNLDCDAIWSRRSGVFDGQVTATVRWIAVLKGRRLPAVPGIVLHLLSHEDCSHTYSEAISAGY